MLGHRGGAGCDGRGALRRPGGLGVHRHRRRLHGHRRGRALRQAAGSVAQQRGGASRDPNPAVSRPSCPRITSFARRPPPQPSSSRDGCARRWRVPRATRWWWPRCAILGRGPRSQGVGVRKVAEYRFQRESNASSRRLISLQVSLPKAAGLVLRPHTDGFARALRDAGGQTNKPRLPHPPRAA